MFADEVAAIIEEAICVKRLNLNATKQLIFQNLQSAESPHIADVKLVENCFIQVLIDCARLEFEKFFDESCNNKHFVDNFMRCSDEISTINDVLRLCNLETYMKQLEEHLNLMDEHDLITFIVNLKAYAWKEILEKSKSGHVELEMLQCLITCFQTNTISQPVNAKLEQFKENCESQSRSGYYLKKLMSTIKIERNSVRQLRGFLQSIKALESDHLFLEGHLLQLIRFYLKPVEITEKKVINRSVIEILGGIIQMSKHLPKIKGELLNNTQQNRVDEIRFIAVHTLEIDCDLENSHWHGFNIFIMAPNVNIFKKCKWDLSGFSSQECYKKAKSGNAHAKNGEDGIDGPSGESSGNVMIIADQIQNAEWLTVILNGGGGGNGQSGGNGADGENGEGISMNELKKQFPSSVHFWGGLHHLQAVYNEICSMGKPNPNWSNEINCYAELKLANGQEIIHSASRYITSNCYLLYKGSQGQAGGLGGMNGLGGEGGYQGVCIAVSKESKPFPINIRGTKGCDGQNGKSGRTGEYGKNGWDVGYVDFQTWTGPIEMGADQNQRLRMNYATDSNGRVYCAYQYDVLKSSMCYATIKASTLQHRKLTENEKSRETSTKRQRQHQAVASRKAAMQRSAMEQTYSEYLENGDQLLNGILQMNAEVTMNFTMMRQKAKTAFEEVEKLKERSREKVSRYQVYNIKKKVKKPMDESTINTVRSSKQSKDQILSKIEKNPLDNDSWMELLQDEFLEDELSGVEKLFHTYQTNRTIETSAIRRIRKKFGLVKFYNIIKHDYLLSNTDGIDQCHDFHTGKYLKISKESNSNLQRILEYQNLNDQNESIQYAFDDILKYRVTTDDFNIVKNYCDELASIKIGNDSLTKFLENLNIADEEDCKKTIEQISLLKFNTIEWKKLLKLLNMFRIDAEASEQLKCIIPVYNKEVPNKNEDLIQHLFDFNNQLYSVKNANATLANLIELLVIEHDESSNEHPRIQACSILYNTFLDKKQKSIEKIHQTIQFLSQRPLKAMGQRYHEFPNFCIVHRTDNISKQELNIDEKLLQKLYHLYLIKQNEIMDWHKYIDDEILEICLKKIKSNRHGPLFELMAWKQQVNLRIYTETNLGQFVCVREHFTFGKQIEHILFRDDQTIECLIVDKEFIKLNITRDNLVTKFQLDRTNKKYFPFDDVEYSNEDTIIYQLCQFFNRNERDQLEDHLKKISTQFIGKNSILSSLLYCFMCNGCHLSSREIFIMINTVLENFINFDQNLELFSYIILAHRQSQLIDELILIKLENQLRKRLENKVILRCHLRNINNQSLKLLLATKLDESKLMINEDYFSTILSLLEYIQDELILESLNLSEWLLILKNSYWQYGLTKGQLNLTHESLEQCSFYLVKLENSYGRELVENLVNVLNDTKILSTKTLLTFVHRFYAEDTDLCSNILDDFAILNTNLAELFPNSNEKYTGEEILRCCQEKMIGTKKQLSYIQHLMIQLDLLSSEDRNLEELIEIMQKTYQHNDIARHLSDMREILTKIERDRENLVLKYAIDSFNRQHASDDSDDYRPAKLIYETCCNDETSLKKIVEIIRSEIKTIKTIENCHFSMLDIVNRGIKLKRGFSLRATQKLVVLLTLINEKNLLTQVATGEGKTLIIAALCIIKCLYGEKLDIVTSCSVLAKRDAESQPPKGNIDLYALFGVRIGHICSEDIDQRIQVFNNCDVIYGDLSSFQRDYLLDRFYGKNILGTRIFENVIVDEVDSMLLDNSNNMLYLSHDIPNMDKLQSLYIYLWQSVNRPINSMEDLKRLYDNSSIKQSVIADLYGMIMQDEVEDHVWKALIKSKTIDFDGRLLKYFKDYTQLVKQLQLSQVKHENRLIFLLNSIASRQRNIKIPENLYEFVERHLDKFIDNAKNALFMSEGVDYVIDVDRTGLDSDLNPKIIIIDKNTGTDQSSSQWHEGLHQFLQIKHGCKLSLMSLKAVFISNVSYLKLYQNLHGLSGTLGSTQEKALLNELYAVDLIKISTSKPKHFFEERSIITGYKEQWICNIYTETKKKLVKRRSVLIIAETVKDVDYITKHLIKQATEEGEHSLDKILYDNLKNPYVYKREHEEFVFGQGNAYLSYGKVIVATNLAGRGTDIKLEQELIKAGGLHVILTFLPANCRVEEQAFGRAARCGEEGSGQLIVIGNEEDGGSYSSKIFHLKNTRDINELQRLNMVKKFYDERITIEEDCFKQFKEHYENLRQQMETCDNTRTIGKLLQDSFLDKWAFWLDANSHLIETQTMNPSNKKLLDDKLQKFLQSISLQFDLWLDSPSQFLKLGNFYVKIKEYGKARNYFNKLITKYPYYLAEVLYYSSMITIKDKTRILLDKTGFEFVELKTNLVRARELFDQRITDCTNDQAIVQSFKKKETNALIHIEAFSEQQKMICQIYNLFINSINDILGHPVSSYNAFVNYELNEILAYDIFNELQRQEILTQPKNAKIILENTLTDIAIEYGISRTAIKELRKQLQENNTITSQSISKILSLPNIEEFWTSLLQEKIFVNEIEYVMINKQKLALIQSSSIQSLIEKNEIKLELNSISLMEIVQYPIRNNEEYIFCSIMFYKELQSSDIVYLETRGICSLNRKASINPKQIEKEHHFAKFDSITISNFIDVDITTDEGIMILEKLSDQHVGVLEEKCNGNYKLKGHIDCSSLPSCYREVTSAILNVTFAYRLAYKHLQEYFQQDFDSKSNLKFQFRLMSSPYQRLIFDLIDKSIIEDVQVDHKKLKCANLKKIFSDYTSSHAQHLDRLKKEENLEYINKVLNQLCCGIDKLETPDCFFSTLEGTLKAQQNLSIVEASWFSLNGMEDIIVLDEQAYSWKFWRNVAIITCMALTQITLGAVIEIYTAGIGTYAASFFINEGISDLFFVTGSLWSGHMTMSSYWQHKKWSMATTVVTCGVGALWSRGTRLSRIGFKVAGPVRTEGGKKVAEMVGRQLAQSVGTGKIATETLKRVGYKLVEGVAYGFAQGAVDHIIINHLHGLCETIQKTIVADVDELFRNHELNETILQTFDTIGEKQTHLLLDHVTRECFEKTSLYTTIHAHCARLYGSISRGISESMRKMSKIGGGAALASKLTKMLLELMPLVKILGACDEIRKMRDSAAVFLANANKTIQDTLAEHNSSTTSKNTSVPPQQTIKIMRDQRMKQWKQTIIEASNQAIANHVIGPILSYGVNQLVGFLGNSIKKQYRSYKEDKYREEFESLKNRYDKKVNDDKINLEERQKELKTYHKALVKLLAKTKDAKLFASIIRENIPMDMTCVQACTNVIDQCMRRFKATDGEKEFTGIRIVIENTDGSLHEYSSSADPSHRILIKLDNNHFSVTGSENIGISKNNCLYESLIDQLPALTTMFSNGTSFREYLSDFIENDEGLQYTISQGWHKFAILRGSYGGAIKEEDYKRLSRCESHLQKAKQVLQGIYKSNPDLSNDIRDQIQKYLNDIDKIARDGLQNDNAVKEIDAVFKDFNTWLDGKLNGDQLILRDELKQRISAFREQATQTLRDSYQKTLEKFLSQAQQAIVAPEDRNAVHVADRVKCIKDDIDLERLADNFRKIRNDPDIIATAMHGQLNNDLQISALDRRCNTVSVGIHKETLYVACNHVGKGADGKETYGIDDVQCERLCQWLLEKKLLLGRYKVIFLEGQTAPKDHKECRAPHGEMQILRFWKDAGILQPENMSKQYKPWSIGASKPACLCCSAALTNSNVPHRIYGNANIQPTNWLRFADIKVQTKLIWNVQTRAPRNSTNLVH